MKTFDFEQHRVIGLVEDKLGDHGFINVIGYCDDNLHVFHPLTTSEAQNLFPPRGKIFAYRFNLKYKELKKSIVCLCIQPRNNDGKDSYVWDWDAEVIVYGQRIHIIKGVFSEDSQHNYDILANNGLLDVNSDKLVYSNGRVYQIIPDNSDRVLKFWEASSLDTVTVDGYKYFVGISLPKHDGLLDITNDEQLANWYLSKIVKKNWSSIVQAQSFRNSESFLRELLSSQKGLDAATIENRLERLLSIDTSISLMFDSLKEIAETPWFSEVVIRSMAQEKELLLEKLKNDNHEEILKIKEEHNLELMQLDDNQKRKIEKLQQEIDEKRKFQKRYERWRAHWTGIFRGVVHLWHDGRCRRLKYLAGSSDLTDKSYLGRTVCRYWNHCSRWFAVGDGTDAAGYQLKILSDVFFSVTETGKRCFQWTQTCGCVWCDR